ncbi:hypothetical protein [Methanobrevibacter filiformis]|uniref:PsbP C-terminal domain-containing protein n=1 Tax=Methanobrevibacter filiformis TaxID=55758 RepID=A0A166DLS3_9EURY|nr:hypothetical protein [Methanobrevibacter filiformis]KZX15732.1 hypothetical protein MBFIL_05960 [Methanobrevibacter filiformis]
MDKNTLFKYFIIILIILFLLSPYLPIKETTKQVKLFIQGEANKEPVMNMKIAIENKPDNISNTNLKVWNKNGIFFYYPKYWSEDQIQEIMSLNTKGFLSRWDDGVIFYISDKTVDGELNERNDERIYKNKTKIFVDGKEAYQISEIKGDYYQLELIVKKDNNHSYVFTFYTDRDLKSKNHALFMNIIKNMRLRS